MPTARFRRLVLFPLAIPLLLPASPRAGEAGFPAVPAQKAGFRQLTPHAWAFVAADERSANGALFVGGKAALAVDPGLTPALAKKFLEGVAEVTDKPLRTVVLTHAHPDHAFGVVCLSDRGFELACTPQTRRSLAENLARTRRALQAGARSPEERRAIAACRFSLPDRLIEKRETFDLGGLEVEVFAPGPGHTHGDLVVWAPSEKVLATGDLFLDRSCPDMEEGSLSGWRNDLDVLLQLPAEFVIPGHFAVGGRKDLARFHDYVAAVLERTGKALAEGIPLEEIGDHVSLPEFSDFAQYPQYRATFADNVRAAAREILSRPAAPGQADGFRILARLKVGLNPHQIAFSPSGRTAFVAAAGSDRIVRVDVPSLRVTGFVPVEETPLGVAVLSGEDLLFTRFQGDRVQKLPWDQGGGGSSLAVGGGPSLLVGPLPDRSYLVSAERSNGLCVVEPGRGKCTHTYPTGARPFPPAATSDGRLAFVPGYDGGGVTVVDLWNERVLETVPVGLHPSGGAVLPGDIDYAVAVRGEDRIAFLNTASHQVVDSLSWGIGSSPFSVVTAPDGRLAFVNNTASHDVSVIALPERRVVARVPVGEIPIVMAVHPSGRTLWVSCEGSHEVDVVAIPDRWRAGKAAPPDPSLPPAEVAVLGMIHGQHRTSRLWGLDQVRETIRRFHPDAVLPEIPPDRWERIWDDYASRGVIEDPRVRLFPEYTDVLLPLKVEMGFAVEPCAGWNKEMSDLRQTRIHEFQTDPRFAERNREYQAATHAVQAADTAGIGDSDDPRVIHSRRYDERIRAELSVYDEFLNDWIGPGGWSNVNRAHYRLIDAAIRRHPGERLLITFGSGHKYWLLDQLRKRGDIRLIDVKPFLPPAPPAPAGTASDPPTSPHPMDAHCRQEVLELHRFFEEWFRADLAGGEEALKRFSEVLDPAFKIIFPDGRTVGRDSIVEQVRGAYGSRRGGELPFRIRIDNLRVRSLDDGIELVIYEEWTRLKGHWDGRLSSALFAPAPGTPNGVRWLHLQETALPEKRE